MLNTKRTDWDAYYSRPYASASLTRRVTAAKLLGLIRKYAGQSRRPLRIVEFGGANSCFCEGLVAALRPEGYDVVDNNQRGLAAFQRKKLGGASTGAHLIDVLSDDIGALSGRYDVCFSVGLIEHFDPAKTVRAITAHIQALRPGGIAIITYPTPTWLYRATRSLAELTGQWIFWDERPLLHEEPERTLCRQGEILHRETNWWIFLTQGIIVVRKPKGDISELPPAGVPS